MFYFFHHLPKCGGTSFNKFLESVFTLHKDYHNPGGQAKDENLFSEYKRNPRILSELQAGDCLAGHYNLPGIHLWERYPDLASFKHKKFSIIREPFDAAKSGVYFAMKRKRLPLLDEAGIIEKILGRNRYFSGILGIESEDQIDEVLDRYWFIAPLTQVDQAISVIEKDIGRKGTPMPKLNITKKPDEDRLDRIKSEFQERAWLDYLIYERCSQNFNELLAEEKV